MRISAPPCVSVLPWRFFWRNRSDARTHTQDRSGGAARPRLVRGPPARPLADGLTVGRTWQLRQQRWWPPPTGKGMGRGTRGQAMTVQPWLKSYPPDVRIEAPLDLFRAERPGEGPLSGSAQSRRSSSWASGPPARNWRRWRRRCGRIPETWRRPGVHVGLFLPNTPHYIGGIGLRRPESRRHGRQLLAAGRTAYAPSRSRTARPSTVTLDPAALYPQAEKLALPPASRRRRRRIRRDDVARARSGQPMAAAGEAGRVQAQRSQHRLPRLDRQRRAHQLHPLGDVKEALAVIAYTGGTT